MHLPDDLQLALAQVLQINSARHLTRTADNLSQRYRAGHAQDQHTFLHSQEDIMAYAAYRLPATYAAIYAALTAIQARRPHCNHAHYLTRAQGLAQPCGRQPLYG